MRSINRREIVRGGLTTAAALLASRALAQPPAKASPRLEADEGEKADPLSHFHYALNTATIRGHKLGLVEQFELAAKAGYHGVEPWVDDIEKYKDGGGSLADMKKRIADLGLSVVGAIGFANWIVDDNSARAKGLEHAKRDMDLVAQLGGTHIAAPPAGATDNANLDLRKAAERYRKLLEAGDAIGVVPQVEVWGFSKSLSRLSECAFVAIESGHPKACVLTDVYHLYKGGTEFASFPLLSGAAMHCMHMNDYPADPPRERIADKDRVYPGEGVAPIGKIIQSLHASGFHGVLSLELFNPTYWKQDAFEVAKKGLESMRNAVRRACDSGSE